jgi:hypothetical protein
MPLCYGGCYLFIKLSQEHSGFTFEKDLSSASSLLKHHSGGHCSEALNLYRDFIASGKKPEPIETPCEWLEQELLIQQQQQQAAAVVEKKKKKKDTTTTTTTTTTAEKTATQSKQQQPPPPKKGIISTTSTTTTTSTMDKYQEQYMKKEVIPRSTMSNLEVKTGDTPRAQVSVDMYSTTTTQQPEDRTCCWCFRSRAKSRVTSSSSSASESTALLKY